MHMLPFKLRHEEVTSETEPRTSAFISQEYSRDVRIMWDAVEALLSVHKVALVFLSVLWLPFPTQRKELLVKHDLKYKSFVGGKYRVALKCTLWTRVTPGFSIVPGDKDPKVIVTTNAFVIGCK
ncbi:unnamed protein product [Allacma fusca]|uniref:Uncharacterized protein n=1 Tax=Allacma fusca TaxID=39272 RepID=A0A8J2PNV0_9HEXA|nr:unnamed protein product [Allacma fusca]